MGGARASSSSISAAWRAASALGRASLDELDAVIVLSPAMAAARIYPCVDPLASRSRLLDPAIVGEEHAAVAARVHEALAAAARLERAGEPGWSDADRRLLGRVRRLRQFFGQPFFIAEPYPHRPGTSVTRAGTVRECAAILDGAHDTAPEEAFRFKGSIEEVLAAARGV